MSSTSTSDPQAPGLFEFFEGYRIRHSAVDRFWEIDSGPSGCQMPPEKGPSALAASSDAMPL